MRLGVVLIPTDPWPEAVQRAQILDAAGVDHIWVYDHLSWRHFRHDPWFSALPWLSGIAAQTERIRLGTMVANPNLRHPLLLAKDAVTLDHISGGRFILGIGAGGTGFDATAYGQEPLTPGQRLDRLDEYTQVLSGLLSGELSDHAGDWVSVSDVVVRPRPVQAPLPLAVAAGGPRSIEVAARRGTAWITNGDSAGVAVTPTEVRRFVADQVERFERACAEKGRDPSMVDRIMMFGFNDEGPLESSEALADVIGAYGEMGFTDLVVHDPRPGDRDWDGDPVALAELLRPHLVTSAT